MGASAQKRTRKDVGALFGQAAAKDEEIWSDDDDRKKDADASSEDEDLETAQEKKVRCVMWCHTAWNVGNGGEIVSHIFSQAGEAVFKTIGARRTESIRKVM